MCESADKITFQEIINIIRKFNWSTALKQAINENNCSIKIKLLEFPPELSLDLNRIANYALKLGVKVVITPDSITAVPTDDVKFITKMVPQHENVIFTNQINVNGADNDNDTLNNVSTRRPTMDEHDHVTAIEDAEMIDVIRESLPDGDYKKAFDIMIQQGETYSEFAKIHGYADTPADRHIATFLGIGNKAYKVIKKSIYGYMLEKQCN